MFSDNRKRATDKQPSNRILVLELDSDTEAELDVCAQKLKISKAELVKLSIIEMYDKLKK